MMLPGFVEFSLYALLVGILLSLGGFALVSLKEGARRAGWISFFLAGAGALVIITALYLGTVAPMVLLAVVIVGTGILVGLATLQVGKADLSRDIPSIRFDERDIMFARAGLKPGSAEYDSYYAMRPENKTSDDLTRSKPGLLSLSATMADPYLFASAKGSFWLTEALHPAVDGPVASPRQPFNPQEATEFVKNLGRYYGALDVGVCELKPYHVYSHIGRGAGVYGAPLAVEHEYAIAFSVEMSYEMIGANPLASGVAESAKQYVEAARVAVQLAAAIRAWGYPARAHMDGNYRVIVPLVGRDAGLGEIGRMGLLMTARQGPRVRLNVVTTDLPLVPDPPARWESVIDFCTICSKCAENCPVKAIPYGDRQEIDGALRWRINADTCFRYWNITGTDCGRCMTVCPYSHPDNLFHNVVRWGIARSGFLRRAALRLDDLFYGVKPERRSSPEWTRVEKK